MVCGVGSGSRNDCVDVLVDSGPHFNLQYIADDTWSLSEESPLPRLVCIASAWMDAQISKLVGPSFLKSLREAFHDNPRQRDVLTHEEFAQLFRQTIDENNIQSLIHQVDINRKKYITWDDFTTFLINCYSHDISSTYLHRLIPVAPSSHSLPCSIQNIKYLPSSILSAHLIAVTSMSTVFLYHASNLTLLREISYVDKLTLHNQSIHQIRDTHQKAKLIKQKPSLQQHPRATILCLAILPVTLHICVGTSDAMITVYELQNSIQVCANYSKLKCPPSFMHAYVFEEPVRTKNQDKLESSQRIVVGDACGTITLLNFDSSGASSIVKVVKALDMIHRLRCHSDRVTGGAYVPAFLSLVSTSIDGTLVILDPRLLTQQRKFDGNHSNRFHEYHL